MREQRQHRKARIVEFRVIWASTDPGILAALAGTDAAEASRAMIQVAHEAMTALQAPGSRIPTTTRHPWDDDAIVLWDLGDVDDLILAYTPERLILTQARKEGLSWH